MRTLIQIVVVVLMTASAYAQTMTPQNDQTVTIRAEGVPIGTLLAELAQRHPLEKLTIQSEVQQHPVWIALDKMPLPLALRRILQASGLDFAIAGRRVTVGDWTAAARRVEAVQAEQEGHPLWVAEEAARRAAEAEQQQAMSDAAGDESMIMPAIPVRFVANGENITYQEPNFVPYKLRPEVRALRMAIDVGTIP